MRGVLCDELREQRTQDFECAGQIGLQVGGGNAGMCAHAEDG
jgi:hypothetical protein